MKVRSAVLIALAFCAAPVLADSDLPSAALADTQLANPAQEAEAKALMEQIRCLVCEGQSVADSNAEMAGDMRALIRERIARGDSASAVKSWLIDRYGTQISYAPPFGADTALLWLAPVLLLGGGLWLVRSRLKLGKS